MTEEPKSRLPDPPAYYKLFSGTDETADFPLEPPPLPDGPYEIFASTLTEKEDVALSLGQGEKQLFPDQSTVNAKAELRMISEAIFRSYLDLLKLLQQSPAQAQVLVEHIKTLFVNGFHLINSLRDEEGKSRLVVWMENQVQQGEETKQQLEALVAETSAKLEQISMRDPEP